MYEYLNMSFLGFQKKSKIRKDPRLGNGLKVHPRWGRRKLWGPPNIFGPNRKGASNTFERAGGYRIFLDQTGEQGTKTSADTRTNFAARSAGRFSRDEIF